MASRIPPPVIQKKKVLVPIAFGTEEIEAVVLIDILRRAGADVVMASIEEDLEIEGSRRIKLMADEQISSCAGIDFDLIALPGGMRGAARLRDCELLKRMTIAQSQQGKLVGAICEAPALALEEWGILRGRKATCHKAFVDKLTSSLTVGARVTVDGHITTSRGPGCAIEFALSFVQQLYGKEKYEDVRKPLVLPSKVGNESSRIELNEQAWSTTGVPRVLVPIANGSEEMEVVIIVDILRRAGVSVVVASVENSLQVQASRKVKIIADKLIKQLDNKYFDLIVLPGGMPGAERLRDCEGLKTLLTEQAEEKNPLGAICAAPAVVLEAHGLLKGSKATCHPAFVGKLPDKSTAELPVVIDGNNITSRGPGTAVEFALSIVEKFYGEEKAEIIAEDMVAQWP